MSSEQLFQCLEGKFYSGQSCWLGGFVFSTEQKHILGGLEGLGDHFRAGLEWLEKHLKCLT